MTELTTLTAISPIDGRYGHKTELLRETFSEYGLIRFRVLVEIRWILALSNNPDIEEIPVFSKATQSELGDLIDDFSPSDATRIKEIELTTNHDVKAVEYFLKKQFASNIELKSVSEFLHFACTSEDINNLCHALMLNEARSAQLEPVLLEFIENLC